MKAILTSTAGMEWSAGSGLYGEGSRCQGAEVVAVKILADRRPAGGGIAYLARFTPPPGKLIRLVAVARSDEHVYVLQGAYCDKTGRPLRGPGDYVLNPAGHPHSAFIGAEVVSLFVYRGQPDEIVAFDVIAKPAGATRRRRGR